jgi:protein SCO1/2
MGRAMRPFINQPHIACYSPSTQPESLAKKKGHDLRYSLASAVPLLLLSLASAAVAHDDAHDLDALMGSKEQFFQAVNEPAPPFTLTDTDGKPVRLSDFIGKVVVLDFVFASCTDLCPLQSEVLADIQGKVNVSVMKDMVQFVTVTTDPEADTPEVMRSYGEAHALDPVNWIFLTVRPGDPEDATRRLSESYNNTFTRSEDGQQMHGAVFHVIDRGGRLAGKFHGLRFEPVNMVLFINGLTDTSRHIGEHAEAGWWGRMKGMFD